MIEHATTSSASSSWLLKTCLDWAGFVQIDLPASLESYAAALGSRTAYGSAMKKNFTPAAMAALVGVTK